MKGKIDLKSFIYGVKKELVEASEQKVGEPFFELTDVEMETSFSLEAGAEAEGGFKLFVSLKGNTKASQTHKLTMKFRPLSNHSSAVTLPTVGVGIGNNIGEPGYWTPIVTPTWPTGPSVVPSPTGPLFEAPMDMCLSTFREHGIEIDEDKLRQISSEVELKISQSSDNSNSEDN